MRLITWNCNMAFRLKAEYILAKKYDILFVPPSEGSEKLNFEHGVTIPHKKQYFQS